MQRALTHTIIQCAQMSEMAEFYHLFLDCAPTIAKEKWVEFKLDGVSIALQYSDEEIVPGNSIILAMAVENVEKVVSVLDAQGIPTPSRSKRIQEDDGRVNLWFLYQDPQGNQVGLYGEVG